MTQIPCATPPGTADTPAVLPLPELAAKINTEHRASVAAMKMGARHAWEAGFLLLEARRKTPSGRWLEWLRDNVDFCPRTATRYMSIAKSLDRTRVSDLSLREALRLQAQLVHDRQGPRLPDGPMLSVEHLVPALKWHGGKNFLARRLIALMPSHKRYVEPFFGGGAVLLAKNPEGVSEVANDIDGELTGFWRVLQDPDTFERFQRRIEAVPFSQIEWEEAVKPSDDRVERAVQFFVRCRQSRGGKGKDFATPSKRLARGMDEQVSAWLRAVEGLPVIHDRLRRVVIRNEPAVKLIQQLDEPNTLFYCDPPYLPGTRSLKRVYRYEMTPDDHCELLATLKACEGMVMLSGYPSRLYEQELKGWRRHDFVIDNKQSACLVKPQMTESIWLNFNTPELLDCTRPHSLENDRQAAEAIS